MQLLSKVLCEGWCSLDAKAAETSLWIWLLLFWSRITLQAHSTQNKPVLVSSRGGPHFSLLRLLFSPASTVSFQREMGWDSLQHPSVQFLSHPKGPVHECCEPLLTTCSKWAGALAQPGPVDLRSFGVGAEKCGPWREIFYLGLSTLHMGQSAGRSRCTPELFIAVDCSICYLFVAGVHVYSFSRLSSLSGNHVRRLCRCTANWIRAVRLMQ